LSRSRAKLEPLAALLASNPDYQILIEAYTDNKGNEVSLQQLTQERRACCQIGSSRLVSIRCGFRRTAWALQTAGAQHHRCRAEKESPR
jgi:hypothetical protein